MMIPIILLILILLQVFVHYILSSIFSQINNVYTSILRLMSLNCDNLFIKLGGIIVFGIAVNIQADSLQKMHHTTVKPNEIPTQLLTQYPYSVIRNPMYFGMLIILIGVVFITGDAINAIFPIFFQILIRVWIIPMEERNLEKAFGQKYISYKKHVMRGI